MKILSTTNKYQDGKRLETRETVYSLCDDYMTLASLAEKMAEALYRAENSHDASVKQASKAQAERIKANIQATIDTIKGYEGADTDDSGH